MARLPRRACVKFGEASAGGLELDHEDMGVLVVGHEAWREPPAITERVFVAECPQDGGLDVDVADTGTVVGPTRLLEEEAVPLTKLDPEVPVAPGGEANVESRSDHIARRDKSPLERVRHDCGEVKLVGRSSSLRTVGGLDLANIRQPPRTSVLMRRHIDQIATPIWRTP